MTSPAPKTPPSTAAKIGAQVGTTLGHIFKRVAKETFKWVGIPYLAVSLIGKTAIEVNDKDERHVYDPVMKALHIPNDQPAGAVARYAYAVAVEGVSNVISDGRHLVTHWNEPLKAVPDVIGWDSRNFPVFEKNAPKP